MRTFDRSDLWFAIVVAALFTLAALVFGPVFVGTAANPSFWLNIALILAISVARAPLSKLGGVLRFVGWFCVGFVATVLWTVVRGEPFNLALTAGVGLMLAVIDIVTEYLRVRKERRRLDERA